jgi:ATP-dependent helicase/nuclease subunit B
VQSAQIVLRWLQQGKTDIAIVAQDRVTARRLRALLERAEVAVADETGWKLSTTRAAAALAAWNDLVSARGETNALLDLLKSPFVFPDDADRSDRVMRIEARLRRTNIAGDWQALQSAFAEAGQADDLPASSRWPNRPRASVVARRWRNGVTRSAACARPWAWKAHCATMARANNAS